MTNQDEEPWVFLTALKVSAFEFVAIIVLSIRLDAEACALIGNLGIAMVGFLPLAWPQLQSKRDHQVAFGFLLSIWALFTAVHGQRAITAQASQTAEDRKKLVALSGGDSFPFVVPGIFPNGTAVLMLKNQGDLPLTVTIGAFCSGNASTPHVPIIVPAHFMVTLGNPIVLNRGGDEVPCFVSSVNLNAYYAQFINFRRAHGTEGLWQFQTSVSERNAKNETVTLLETDWSDPTTGDFKILPPKKVDNGHPEGASKRP